jgi:glutamate synthase domain-containing protein 3
MSGGFAYVFDESGDFSRKLCNRSMVDVDPLDDTDEATVRSLIEKHLRYTASPRAQLILEHWAEMIKKFVKVFPHDYKRVLGMTATNVPKKKIAAESVVEVSHG